MLFATRGKMGLERRGRVWYNNYVCGDCTLLRSGLPCRQPPIDARIILVRKQDRKSRAKAGRNNDHMGILRKLQDKTGEVRAREKIRPLIESRMMRDILLEIGQRGSEGLDPQSVPLEQRTRAARIASECGLAGMRQSVVDEVRLNAAGITLVCDGEETTFLFGDYNYEDIQDTDCLPAVAQYLVQHMRGYYNITRTFSSVSKPNGRGVDKKTHEVTISRHHEDTPFEPGPVQKQRLF